MAWRSALRSIPVLGPALVRLRVQLTGRDFTSAGYWDDRYRQGGTSGDGSVGRLATYKAQVLNEFVAAHHLESVVELGCGDGDQLALARYPSYVGYDVSRAAVEMCRARFAGDSTKTFAVGRPTTRADLALSLDVIYHLVEDDVFEQYMSDLFDAAIHWVIVYSSNDEGRPAAHVRHRRFADWVAANRPAWHLIEHRPNPYRGPANEQSSFADFYIFAAE